MPRPERALDPDDPWAPMARQLRALREAAQVSYGELGRRVYYSGTAMSMTAATGGGTIPSWSKVEKFVTACGVTDAGELAAWRQRYDAAAAAARPAPTNPAPTEGAAAADELVDPAAAQTRAQFGAGLRALRNQAGLSYKQVADSSKGVLAKSTVGDLLVGRIWPTEATVKTFVSVCAQQIPVDVDAWLTAWQRITAANAQPRRTVTSTRALASRAPIRDDCDFLRELAARTPLAEFAETLDGRDRRTLTGAAYRLAMPIVFHQITRHLELRRGHVRCAVSSRLLDPECHDRFADDVDAVVEDLLRQARIRISNLDGWIVSRLNAALVDANRRRRGSVGAMQRPRLPQWLQKALHDDAWLTWLALSILDWVGVPVAAGNGLWPLEAWAQRHEKITSTYGTDTAAVERDIARVLTVMRCRPAWYERFVQEPLARKQQRLRPLYEEEEPQVALRQRREAQDDRLLELSNRAIEEIRIRMGRRRQAPETVVTEVITEIFAGGTGADELDRPPGEDGLDTHIANLLVDPDGVGRIVTAVLAVINDSSQPVLGPDVYAPEQHDVAA
ncbi:helix-turn-helix domain-containing protein [Dactylosporangium sp. CA-139114]|uniref:helix-turn-helix domain-containing protein n=1 Tax=Dactylosporangium sp. CA-139114 TaxID=3239931 RepID=UPI003D967D7F